MKIIEGDNYEELCAEFQFEWVDMLRKTLAKHGVPAETAKKICGDFTFDLSMLFDQGELESNGNTYRPLVGFTDDAEEASLTLQEGTVELHEHAYGTTTEVFRSS
jgi:hypothetical protein